MSAFLIFLIGVIIITISGALAPGPLLFTNLTNAPRWGWKGGIWLSVGHTFIELPLIFLIATGLNFFINNNLLQLITASFGGIVLLLFGIFQINDAIKMTQSQSNPELDASTTPRHPLITGIIFSGLNPYFLIWWLTVGTNLVIEALLLAAFAGVVIMFLSHVWMDYVWLAGTAWLVNKGTNITGSRGYQVLVIFFSIALIFFGIAFLWKAYTLILQV
jgi:threonine/homoserine/homoserine lactone efflux protein